MPRPPSRASKVSLHRIRIAPDEPLRAATKEDYLDRDSFDIREVSIGDRPGLMIYGQILNEAPDWLDHVQSLTSYRPQAQNDTSAGLLLLRLNDQDTRCYGLSWGMGHLVISGDRLDDGFGLRFALRRADSDQISALTAHALDTLPRTARLSIFGGTGIKSFGMEEIGEVVSRIVGRIPATGFSSDNADRPTFITVRGADALGIPLAKESFAALADLRLIDSIIETESPAAGLEHLENTKPLRPGHPQIDALNTLLSEHIADMAPGRLAMSWPAEWTEEAGEAASYRISGLPKEGCDLPELELNDIIDPVAERPDPDKIALLKRLKIQGLDSNGSAISRAISADKWITFECDHESKRYVMQRGRWFNVGGAYIDMLEHLVGEVLKRTSDIEIPAWPQEEKVRRRSGSKYIGPATERLYNEYAASQNSALLCMDRKLVATAQHPSGFEACDLLHVDGSLIHVKRLDDSVSASHLFNQAIVSAEALRRQADARDEFRKKVDELSGGTHTIPADFRPYRVILAFSGGGAVADSIFTFSKIALVRCAQKIEAMGIDLEIARIGPSDELMKP